MPRELLRDGYASRCSNHCRDLHCAKCAFDMKQVFKAMRRCN